MARSFNLTCEIYDLSLEAVAMGILCMFGFVGNILSIICLMKDKSKTATPLLLVSLEISDTLFLATVFVLRVLATIAQYTQSSLLLPLFPYLAKYVFPIALVCQTGTIYLTVLVTVNRYLTVCRPYQKFMCSAKNARKHVVFVWLFAGIYNIPRFFQYDIKIHTDPYTNTTMKSAAETDMANHKAYQIAYCNVFYFLVMFFIPLITLSILNWKLIDALKWTKQKRKQLLAYAEHSPRSEDDITLILIIIVLVFVVCQTPALITQLLMVFLKDSDKLCPKAYFFYERISDLLVVANCSINFLIYCFCSARYRQILVNLLCRQKHARLHANGNARQNGHTRNISDTTMFTKYTSVTGDIPQEDTEV